MEANPAHQPHRHEQLSKADNRNSTPLQLRLASGFPALEICAKQPDFGRYPSVMGVTTSSVLNRAGVLDAASSHGKRHSGALTSTGESGHTLEKIKRDPREAAHYQG